MSRFYAHTKQDRQEKPLPTTEWEPLFTKIGDGPAFLCAGKQCKRCERLDEQHGHLNKVAWWTAQFATQMFPVGPTRGTAHQWGYFTGLWHDLGKFSKEFQSFLRKAGGAPHEGEVHGKVDHSSAGAQHAIKKMAPFGHILAYPIAGHHSGLLDAKENTASQRIRLQKIIKPTEEAPAELLNYELSEIPPSIKTALANPTSAGFSIGFFTRMLFSCLCDADFLATEKFMNPKQAHQRSDVPQKILQRMLKCLDYHLDSLTKKAIDTPVNRNRADVLTDCRASAESAPGLFTLTVPTGGGKTLSSLSFALRHAVKYDLQRIIYVAPFTSIIEQNAEVYREVFQSLETPDFSPVLEHHSSLSPEKETTRSRLATENWDAPLIVTTAVQLYESLFSCKTSKARKLHNVARSVIVLDEAQSLPVNLLNPCLSALRELTENYGATVVLCTATQPAIIYDEQFFPIGFKQCTEIIRDKATLFAALERVKIENKGTISDADLIREISEQPQSLCVVNRRQHAFQLFNLLGENESNYHLSALMCPEHRSEILKAIKQRLKDGLPTRVISTQLVEAGVDVDFPVVFRALAGLDSIAQAAGRCNRDGRLTEPGTTYIFKPEHQEEEAYFRLTAQIAAQVIDLHEDLLGEDAIRCYFELYYHQQGKASKWDNKGIMDCFRVDAYDAEFPFHFDFKKAASEFRLIENDYQMPVIIPFDENSRQLIGQLRNETVPLHRRLFRGLQRYTVQIPIPLFAENQTAFEILRDDQFHVLVSPELHYSPNYGVSFDDKHQSSQILGVW